MLRETYPYYLAGRPVEAAADLEVFDKYTGEVAARVPTADSAALEKAIAAAGGTLLCGGVKESGRGREGIRFAMEDMTEIRLLVLRTP